MNTLLQNMNCQVNVSITLVTAIANVNLRPPSSQAAHPFSTLHTPYYDASSSNAENDTKLQLMASDGLWVDKATAESLAKDSFSIPATTHKLRHQLNTFWGVKVLIFGQDSLLASELSAWVKHIDSHETTYDEQFKIDANFRAKICSLVDRSVHQLLGSCLIVKYLEEVEWEILCQAANRAEIRKIASKQIFQHFWLKRRSQTPTMKTRNPSPRSIRKGVKENQINKNLWVKWFWTPKETWTGTATVNIAGFSRAKWSLKPHRSTGQVSLHATSGMFKDDAGKNVPIRNLTNHSGTKTARKRMMPG